MTMTHTRVHDDAVARGSLFLAVFNLCAMGVGLWLFLMA
jgi:hypothetical protein